MPDNDETTNTTLELSLLKTIGNSDLGKIGADAGELLLDALLQNGALGEFPVINSIVGFAKTGLAIRDHLFLKKVLRFLHNLKDIPMQDRQQFISKLERKKQERRVGENLLLLLDRCDHLDKPLLISKLFAAYLVEEIDYDEFLQLSTAIDRASMKDLNDLLAYFSGKNVNTRTLWRHLHASGLSEAVLNAEIDKSLGGLTGVVLSRASLETDLIIYTYNREALKLAKIILGDDIDAKRERLPFGVR